MLAHHLAYIVVYIVFLLFEKIAHYASTYYMQDFYVKMQEQL